MKSEFKAKFLQNLVRKNKGNEGFTLIELLVVIIIVGVLAAIALPSFLSQIGKARGSEAKSSLGTINRSQQAYFLEKNAFSSNLGGLDAKVTGKFYSYVVASSTPTTSATAVANVQSSQIKASSSMVAQSGDVFSQILCESEVTTTGTAAAPAAATVPGSTTRPNPAATPPDLRGGCATGYVALE